MHLSRLTFRKLISAVLLGAWVTSTLSAAAQTPATIADKLASLASRAAIIFSGQVCSIERHAGVVEITFNVEQAVLGTPGNRYVLREWAGLWPPGQFRYTVGQRALVFLHGTGASGLASPVDGAAGVVPIVVQGPNAPRLLDIRRLAAAVLRTPATPLPTEENAAIELGDAVTLITQARQAVTPDRLHRLPPPFRLPAGGPVNREILAPLRTAAPPPASNPRQLPRYPAKALAEVPHDAR